MFEDIIKPFEFMDCTVQSIWIRYFDIYIQGSANQRND